MVPRLGEQIDMKIIHTKNRFSITLNVFSLKRVQGYRGPFWLGLHWPFTLPKDLYADWWELIFCGWILSLGVHK